MMQAKPMASEGAEPGFARRNALVLVLAVVLAIVVTVTGLTWVARSSTLDAQDQRIDELEGQLQAEELATSEQVEQNVLEALGVSTDRLAGDTVIIGRLVETAFTWDSGPAYEAARADLKEHYALPEDEPFLEQFMPPSRFNEDASGQRYYYIDTQGMNSTVTEEPDIEVVRVSAGEYTYAVLVDVSITSDAVTQNNANPSRVTAQRTMLLFLTVDAEGDVLDLSGAPSSGSTRHSR